jgi:hypothetical protein
LIPVYEQPPNEARCHVEPADCVNFLTLQSVNRNANCAKIITFREIHLDQFFDLS